jgi:DNA polymerase-3 subunit delta
MARPAPLFYVFYGSDEFSRSETLNSFKKRLGSPDTIDLNTTVLDKASTSLAELRHACDAIPFLAEKRLVIAVNLLTRLSAKAGHKLTPSQRAYRHDLCEYLPTLPETTRLVFVDDDDLPARHPVVKLAKEHDRGYLKRFAPPSDDMLPSWIHKQVQKHGGQIDEDAAYQLGAVIHGNLRLLDQEITKLVTYTNGQRPITLEDVQMLVPYTKEVLIWDMVDAIGQRNHKTASQGLHQLLIDNQHPLYLLTMIVRQFRLLIQVKDLESRGATQSQVIQTLHLHPFPARKLHDQATRLTADYLENAYRLLLDTDVAIKTGEIEAALALDLLVVSLCT